MPNFDKTGPKGEGPRTGRQMGDCVEKRCIDERICRNGVRKRCCTQINGGNQKFYQERRARRNNISNNDNNQR